MSPGVPVNQDGSIYASPTTSTPVPSSAPSSKRTSASTSTTSAIPSSTGLSSTAKVVLGVGLSLGIICIILIITVIFLLRRYRVKKQKARTAQPGYGIEGAPAYGTETAPAERDALSGPAEKEVVKYAH
ncbi:MAG: hypothetical protein M1812_006040 [Candelaria pacifica]|nr:MAG: hypothetical protein M1812_006040 [Candelaria pacifica]